MSFPAVWVCASMLRQSKRGVHFLEVCIYLYLPVFISKPECFFYEEKKKKKKDLNTWFLLVSASHTRSLNGYLQKSDTRNAGCFFLPHIRGSKPYPYTHKPCPLESPPLLPEEQPRGEPHAGEGPLASHRPGGAGGGRGDDVPAAAAEGPEPRCRPGAAFPPGPRRHARKTNKNKALPGVERSGTHHFGGREGGRGEAHRPAGSSSSRTVPARPGLRLIPPGAGRGFPPPTHTRRRPGPCGC